MILDPDFGLADQADLDNLRTDAIDEPQRRGPRRAIWFTLASVQSAPDASTASMKFDEDGSATLHWSASEGQAVLVATGLPNLDKQHDFELWIVRGDQPISLGVMNMKDGRDTTVIADGFEAGDTIAVTIEDEGGAPEGVPTTDPILVIASA